MGATEQLARFIAETDSDTVSEEALDAATTGLLDAVGTALTVAAQESDDPIIEYTRRVGGTPTSRVIGTDIKTSAPDAALANGTLSYAAGYDSIGTGGFGHGAAVLMPTVLALGEQLHRSGLEVLEAYVLGYEVGARMGTNIGAGHYACGWSSVCTVWTLAAAAAASRLMKLDVEQTRTALGIAASHASRLQANAGYMVSSFHAGNSARGGVVAATLASMGYDANPDIMEAPRGYLAAFGDQQSDLGGMTLHLGEAPYNIVSPGFYVKEWPCCYTSQGAISMVLGLLAKFEISPEQVDGVEFTGFGASGFLNRPNVNTSSGAKASLQFIIAAAVVQGNITHDTFTEENVKSTPIQQMMARITLSKNPARATPAASITGVDRSQRVTIRLNDGNEVTDAIERITNTLEGQQVDAKFEANACRLLPGEQAKRALGLLRNLKKVPDVTEIMDSVTTG